MKPASPSMRRSYDRHWAAEVVQRLWDSYPRASEMIRQLTGVGREIATSFLSSGSTSWTRYRKAIQVCDKWLQAPSVCALVDQGQYFMFDDLARFLQRNHIVITKEGIDKMQGLLHALRAGFKGGSGGSEATDGPDLPLDSLPEAH